MKKYDYLIVGAGLYGSVFAFKAREAGKKCLVIDKRNHIAGNIYTELIEGVQVHKYGAHIFHTNNKTVWEFVNKFCEFNNFVNSPIANYKGKLYNLPFNMNTFYEIWGVKTPEQAQEKIKYQTESVCIKTPKNLEEQAISLVGQDIYEILIKGYTEKQWGRSCKELPASIIKRLPVRFCYNNNYFNAKYQGIPIDGYTVLVERMLNGVDVILGVDYFSNKSEFDSLSDKIVFTGTIDSYYDYCFGALEYRSVRFETEILDTENYQGVAVMNFTDNETPYTRIIEHKHFNFGNQKRTVISKEFSAEWKFGDEPYYPVNNERNQGLYLKYRNMADIQNKVLFGGRLGCYRYYDMDKVIEESLSFSNEILSQKSV